MQAHEYMGWRTTLWNQFSLSTSFYLYMSSGG